MGTERPVVLVVEDNEDEREKVKADFEAKGYEVIDAVGFDQAVQIIPELPEHVLIHAKGSQLTEIIRAAAQDHLTGLDNYWEFKKRVLAQLKALRRKGEPTPVSLLFIDVDFFKEINDTHGHLLANEVLKMVARMMEQITLRPADRLCRMSGDEFLIFLPDTDEATAISRGKLLQEKISENPVIIGGGPKGGGRINYSISFGAGSVGKDEILDPEQALETLMKQAENNPNNGLLVNKRRR